MAKALDSRNSLSSASMKQAAMLERCVYHSTESSFFLIASKKPQANSFLENESFPDGRFR